MVHHRHFAVISALALGALLSACGNFSATRPPPATDAENVAAEAAPIDHERVADGKSRSKIWDLFTKNDNPNVTVKVNKYLWNASLDVLNFLPIQSIDPFTGVIVTGYGTPPGGGRSYRATIYIQDPALDARSLKLSLQGSNGASVAPETVTAVEDAILNRARQLRIADSHL